jgi:hypothetical protein
MSSAWGTSTGERALAAQPSDEATEHQLALARAQGDAYGAAVEQMVGAEATGDQVRAADMIVGYAVEEAEGMYAWSDGQLEWHEPEEENAHIEVVVRDAQDGRFIPGLDVTVTVSTPDGDEVGSHQQPFLWHPWLHHYGRNWTLPGDGKYDIAVHIRPAGFMRHDKENGGRFASPVVVEFGGVQVETGQKHS